ncbi:MAG: TrkA family potassium uptake protein [Clostridia bacterium]|nr:TrkA family potassium uptake protein [Clostridia bacterium]
MGKKKDRNREAGRAIKQQDMLFAVIGIGRFGFAVAEEMAKKGYDVIVVDKDKQAIDLASEFTENAFLTDDLSYENLKSAGIGEADCVIIGMAGHLEDSVLTTMNVKKLGVKRIIAKANSAEHGEILRLLGAEVVHPEHDMGVRLASRLSSPNVIEYLSLSDELDLVEITLTSAVEGKTVQQLNIRQNFGLNIVAVSHNGAITADIRPDTSLHAQDTVTVIGRKTDIKRFENYLNR